MDTLNSFHGPGLVNGRESWTYDAVVRFSRAFRELLRISEIRRLMRLGDGLGLHDNIGLYVSYLDRYLKSPLSRSLAFRPASSHSLYRNVLLPISTYSMLDRKPQHADQNSRTMSDLSHSLSLMLAREDLNGTEVLVGAQRTPRLITSFIRRRCQDTVVACQTTTMWYVKEKLRKEAKPLTITRIR